MTAQILDGKQTAKEIKAELAVRVHPSVHEVASWVAPMPGGVGPMTRAMLLSNVVDRAEALAVRSAEAAEDGAAA